MDGISKIKGQYAPLTGYGNIVIPSKVVRDDYVKTCYNRERVSVLLANGGGLLKDCYISREVLREVTFPSSSNELGDMVTFIRDIDNSKATIVGVISKESQSQLLEEGEFQLSKTMGNSSVTISGKAESGVLLIDVEDNNDIGELTISVSGKNDGSSLNLKCKGNTTIYADDSVNIETADSVKLKSTNATTSQEVLLELTNNKIKIENDIASLKSILEELVNQMSAITVPTPAGTSGIPLNIAQIQAILKDINILMD